MQHLQPQERAFVGSVNDGSESGATEAIIDGINTFIVPPSVIGFSCMAAGFVYQQFITSQQVAERGLVGYVAQGSCDLASSIVSFSSYFKKEMNEAAGLSEQIMDDFRFAAELAYNGLLSWLKKGNTGDFGDSH